ncbi:hypothetical protein LF1_04920 [Rubripirellula obstinata]|uniref:Uncharacterized protein n=1 Tax=Rubripirellula obstinata TaxID=406547 RepID=A0A5B1CCN5_9BACT|nr:hypothetical protein [Rubripirellula obstinata]KAA1258001.1 hypothetical protein LF1_04920 [Rubripirellula obstinata]
MIDYDKMSSAGKTQLFVVDLVKDPFTTASLWKFTALLAIKNKVG